ncbi:MAG TPA: nucleotidyl transferase AbiEii/AbiGii toxin family protein [Candidatus Paceibacterota bacterium]|nr:nucleotidyl transferase AbiEii/AbiGii toxin family protein [Candidatus Paceibacterota bacterium]
MKPRYATAAALRAALEIRLNTTAAEQGLDLQRLRRQVAFDRFLCRLFRHADSPWLLKGGCAMELRIRSARTTRDIDLGLLKMPGGAKEWDALAVRNLLADAASLDLEDGFAFVIGEPGLDLDAAPYGGSRFPVDARMAGRRFISFHLDVSAGDVLREPFEPLEGRDWLGFAGIAPSRVPAISREEQFAEKLHAYSLPREGRPNSRVKDLVDLLLLIESGMLDGDRVRQCIEATFRRRDTHPVPSPLGAPPQVWAGPFAEMAANCGLSQDSAAAFWRWLATDPRLSGFLRCRGLIKPSCTLDPARPGVAPRAEVGRRP